MEQAIEIIRNEHRRFATVLFCLEGILKDLRRTGAAPDVALLETIIEYIDGFLDRYHHPKEDEYLFPALQQRHPAAGELLDRLQAQHREGERLLAGLKRAVADTATDGANALAALQDAATAYIAFERDHVRIEETELMPLAETHLLARDWEFIEAAFAENQDPLFGEGRKRAFDRLFTKIVTMAPAPHGVGPPLTAAKGN